VADINRFTLLDVLIAGDNGDSPRLKPLLY